MIHNRKQIRAIIAIDTVLIILVGLLVAVEEDLGISRELLCLSEFCIHVQNKIIIKKLNFISHLPDDVFSSPSNP